ncbi:aldehyde dehydrogenase [Chytridium lagenaria]|nr:aldehyde dehydrogenase [Chytridium lagenaria]
MTTINILSPVDGKIVASRHEVSLAEAQETLSRSHKAFDEWRKVPLEKRIEVVRKLVEKFLEMKDEAAEELANLIGRPLKHYVPAVPAQKGYRRFIRREPHGVVLLIAAWNYPYLITVNGLLPALLGGNTVILKQAPQTYPCADRIVEAAKRAGVPEGVVQALCAGHDVLGEVMKDRRVGHVHFTGSVRGGREVGKVLSERFIAWRKNPAYVREDADPAHAAENLIDGAMYNSGQSCCAIERIYVHEKVYDRFVEEAVKAAMVKVAAADAIREHLRDAVAKGAKALVDESLFSVAKAGTAFVAPQVLVNVDHTMKIMTEETFGPVVGVMKVKSDDEAVALMNDSEYGLTASVWTKDEDAAFKLMERIDAGTVFMNRCDYLDPGLPWTGIKESGRGSTLSKLGFEAMTRPKAFHLRLP